MFNRSERGEVVGVPRVLHVLDRRVHELAGVLGARLEGLEKVEEDDGRRLGKQRGKEQMAFANGLLMGVLSFLWTEPTTESTKHQKVEATSFDEICEVKKATNFEKLHEMKKEKRKNI